MPAAPDRAGRRRLLAALAGAPAALHAGCAAFGPPATMRVGPGRDIRRLADAARRARDGEVIEVDAGEYRGDVAVWRQDRLTIRAAGGRVRLVADGAAAERKAIWVVRGGEVTVDGFDFEGARVPSRNGAGIRFEAGRLSVRRCRFVGNEMGLLTGNDPRAELDVAASEFAHNLRPDGHNHQLYAGRIARLRVRACWLHHGSVGHLLKSRAAVSHVLYSRLVDEDDGRASYELEFPDGGLALVLGNLVQQGPLTENTILVSYGAEGFRWPDNALALAHNTLVDGRPEGGVLLRVAPGPAEVVTVNNLSCGAAAAIEAGVPGEHRSNLRVAREDFVDAAAHDYRLAAPARAGARAADAGVFRGTSLRPTSEYRHPCAVRALRGSTRLVGALQT